MSMGEENPPAEPAAPSSGDRAESIARDMGIWAGAPMSDTDAAEFRERFGEARSGPVIVLPPRFLTEDRVRQLLSECVTVVKPGETLVLRMGREWTPSQMREVQDMLDVVMEDRELPFRALVVPADGLGVAQSIEERDGG